MRDDDRYDDYRDVVERYRKHRDWEEEDEFAPPEEVRASRTGIISFVLALVLGPITLGLFVVAGVLSSTTPGGLADDSVEAMLLGLGIMLCLGCMLVGLIVGICALRERRTMKVLPLVGTVVNALLLLGTLGLIVLGLIFG
jgi:hypothetical protein